MKKMIRLLLLSSMLLLAGALWWFSSDSFPSETDADVAFEYELEEEGERPSYFDAYEYIFQRTLDPALGYPPVDRLLVAMDETRRMQQQYLERADKDGGLGNARWRERGPNNVGGRTRVILLDDRDPQHRKVWAGGVSGGLWYTEDITQDPPLWNKVDDFLENLSVGSLAQDPNDLEVFYLGTGESFSNGDAMAGLAIFKSTDGGLTWDILPNTNNGSFRATRDLFVHPETSDVYAATTQGLWRSQNGGNTWTKVLGNTVGFANESMYDIDYDRFTNTMYVSNRNAVFKSVSGNPNDWQNLTAPGTNFPTGLTRVEIAVARSQPNTVYMVGGTSLTIDGESTRGASKVYVTTNGGQVWQQRTEPTTSQGRNVGIPQVLYDLDIGVHPEDPDYIVVGGVPIARSLNGGLNWQSFPQGHVDHHVVLFDENNPNIMYNGSDGGVYRVIGGTQVEDKNFTYNVTQFYACAIHPDAGRDYFLGGTQDNFSLRVEGFGTGNATPVRGGDGAVCHIDQNEPNIQMVSSQFGNYSLTLTGGDGFSDAIGVNGNFVNESDYDDESNIMYAQTFDGDFYRWKVMTGDLELVNIDGYDISASAITVDPNVPNRVYFGVPGGRIYRVDNAHEGSTVTATELVIGQGGFISCIAVQEGDPDHLLATYSNYGVTSIFESTNGGQSWTAVEGNLPDMPVWWVIFNPDDFRSAMIGTEAGAWVTELLNGNNTEWIPPVPGIGIPLTRVTMLQMRKSDKVVLASTHGRGLFTTDVFAQPAARMSLPTISYTNAPIVFVGEVSTGADTYFWDFGDGVTSTEANPQHSYTNFGTYPVSLTINNELSVDSTLQILPDQALPYQIDAPGYAGHFETNPEQYGVENIGGSRFVRGQSTIPGKSGVHSGSNAFVLAPEDQFYAPNTEARLYLPNFDFSDQTIYTFSFWANHQIHSGFDGFRVEYSTDRGQSWRVLGTADDPEWYNFTNRNAEQAAWPIDASYFTGQTIGWEQYKVNVSFLAGRSDVAFRFVFRSEGTGNYAGLAIDDVEITKYEGEPITTLLKFEGEYTTPEEITVRWTTEPEFKCKRFELERSINGRDFEVVETTQATGRTSAELQSYSEPILGQRNLYFFRLKVISEDEAAGYYYEFYSPVIVVRRNIEGTEVYRLFPNPFTDRIELTFNNVVDVPVQYTLYDAMGRLIREGQLQTESVFGTINLNGNLQFGTYFLQIRIGEDEAETFKLLGGGK